MAHKVEEKISNLAGGQRRAATAYLAKNGIARFAELRDAGVTAATMSRMERDGEVIRLSRGLYQLPDAPMGADHSFAQAAKQVPKGVVCLISALAFHGLTDQLPKRVWLAVSKTDWHGQKQARIRIVQMADHFLKANVETHRVEGVPVRVFSAARTVADCFRHRRTVGLNIAIEGLQEALRQRKATPAELSLQAASGGVATVMRPYLEALTANG